MSVELIQIFIWWSFFFVLGVVSIPLTYLLFNKFVDLGYGFSKTVGLLVLSYPAFLFSTAKLMPFSQAILFFLFVVYVVTNYLIFKIRKKEILQDIKDKFGILIFQEILFTTGLLFWAWVRGHNPDIEGLEKFMDFGFINSILKSNYLPPTDMWFSGKPINYYWFGHFYTALATKITGISPAVTYNLMIATILGLTLNGVFSIASSLVAFSNSKTSLRVVFMAGVISTLLVAFAGNFHTPFYALKDGVEKYWYPDATRFIGYNPETNDKTIHEFPLYSFVVSDLHGHLLNLPFVILYIALLLLLTRNDHINDKNNSWILKLLPQIIPLGFLLGIMFMTSTWDFGNYLVLTGVVSVIFNLLGTKSFNSSFVFKTILIPVSILILSLIFASPFIFNFKSIAEGIAFVRAHTPLWQLAILWGFPAVLTLIFIGTLVKNRNSLTRSDFFVLSLLICAWVLIFLPEIIFVKDIYIATHHRANTMFKLTYQAFVMSYLTGGYIAVKYLQESKTLLFKLLGIIFFSLIFGAVLWYPNFAINAYYGDLKTFRGLSGDAWVLERQPGIYKAIVWLRENVEGQPTILEVAGDSYTGSNIISAYTGLPTVEGWFVHEWLWRGSSEIPQARSNEVSIMYTSENLNETAKLLRKYKVLYIIVSPLERDKYPNINLDKILKLAYPVFNSEDTTIYKVK